MTAAFATWEDYVLASVLLNEGDVPTGLGELIPPRPPWMADAACAEPDIDPALYFATGSRAEGAKAICARCLVLDECFTYALTETDLDGIWGGTTAQERRAIRKASRAVAA